MLTEAKVTEANFQHADLRGARLSGAEGFADEQLTEAWVDEKTELPSGIERAQWQKYVWIPPGEFQMGCVPVDVACDADENTRHEVKIGKGFWMGRTEVTGADYKLFIEKKGKEMGLTVPSTSEPDYPIVEVSWNDAKAYCEWSGGRLPTETEWEYAARAGREGLTYPWGNRISRGNANYDFGVGAAAPVGSYPANGFGLHDMSGNVWEWVADWYDADHYSTRPSDEPTVDPKGPEEARGMRVLRGGSWYVNPVGLRASVRVRLLPDGRYGNIGFRCAREVISP